MGGSLPGPPVTVSAGVRSALRTDPAFGVVAGEPLLRGLHADGENPHHGDGHHGQDADSDLH
jgi:hypothetical protein